MQIARKWCPRKIWNEVIQPPPPALLLWVIPKRRPSPPPMSQLVWASAKRGYAKSSNLKKTHLWCKFAGCSSTPWQRVNQAKYVVFWCFWSFTCQRSLRWQWALALLFWVWVCAPFSRKKYATIFACSTFDALENILDNIEDCWNIFLDFPDYSLFHIHLYLYCYIKKMI